MATKSTTSKKVATVASKTLKDPKATKEAKSVAASALANAPDKPKRASKAKAPVEVVEAAPVEAVSAPAVFGFFRVNGHIIEATPKGNIKHWRVDNVHCTEPTDMTVEDGEPMTKQEIFEELH